MTTPPTGPSGDESTEGTTPPSFRWASDEAPPAAARAVPPPVEQPASIRLAVRLMYLGAALTLIGVLVGLTQTDEIREAIQEADDSLSGSDLDMAVNVAVAMSVVFGLVGVGLWIWMAVVNGRGESWARVVATVLAGLNLVSIVFTVAGGGATTVTYVSSAISVALAAVILVLLYRPESSRFYELRSR